MEHLQNDFEAVQFPKSTDFPSACRDVLLLAGENDFPLIPRIRGNLQSSWGQEQLGLCRRIGCLRKGGLGIQEVDLRLQGPVRPKLGCQPPVGPGRDEEPPATTTTDNRNDHDRNNDQASKTSIGNTDCNEMQQQ